MKQTLLATLGGSAAWPNKPKSRVVHHHEMDRLELTAGQELVAAVLGDCHSNKDCTRQALLCTNTALKWHSDFPKLARTELTHSDLTFSCGISVSKGPKLIALRDGFSESS